MISSSHHYANLACFPMWLQKQLQLLNPVAREIVLDLWNVS